MPGFRQVVAEQLKLKVQSTVRSPSWWCIPRDLESYNFATPTTVSPAQPNSERRPARSLDTPLSGPEDGTIVN